jgi:hypothetical protein
MHCLSRVRALKSYTGGRKNDDFHQNKNSTASLCVYGYSMSKRKLATSKFCLEEKAGVVTASPQDENDYSLQHTIHGIPNPKVRAPRADKQYILDWSISVGSSPYYDSQEQYLKESIANTNQEINKQVQEIRKTLKRIQSLTHFVVTSKEVLSEINKAT